MTWGKLSDDLHSHPKWTAASPNAKALWATGISYCSSYLTDGKVHADEHLPTIAVETFGLVPSAAKKARAAAAELVDRGLWETTATGWRFHDWRDYNPTGAQVRRKKKHDKRREWLHKSPEGRKLKRLIRDRDGDLCSWCAEPVRWGANRAPDGGTYDHVDPDGPDEAHNLIVSCNSCNGTKSDRDHDEIGFELREGHMLRDRWCAGRTRPTDDPPASTRPGRDSVATQSPGLSDAGSGRVGSGRVEASADPDPDPDATRDEAPPHTDEDDPGD